ncbi:hypothetical protein CRG98_011953 [Punica granatum]|uniref:Uncharacterized protein n=1 Tax=Punica granatum TaxID=22663 RepID=A0A2I0KHH0_PUNGR|nr:hypothetical protein CRG98_011953 [Punica granatum]
MGRGYGGAGRGEAGKREITTEAAIFVQLSSSYVVVLLQLKVPFIHFLFLPATNGTHLLDRFSCTNKQTYSKSAILVAFRQADDRIGQASRLYHA